MSGPGAASSDGLHGDDSSQDKAGPARESSWDFTPDVVVPSPSNLPTNEDDVLYPPRPSMLRRDMWTLTDQPGCVLSTGQMVASYCHAHVG